MKESNQFPTYSNAYDKGDNQCEAGSDGNDPMLGVNRIDGHCYDGEIIHMHHEGI